MTYLTVGRSSAGVHKPPSECDDETLVLRWALEYATKDVIVRDLAPLIGVPNHPRDLSRLGTRLARLRDQVIQGCRVVFVKRLSGSKSTVYRLEPVEDADRVHATVPRRRRGPPDAPEPPLPAAQGPAPGKNAKTIDVKPITLEVIEVDIGGLTPLILAGEDTTDDWDDQRHLDAQGRDCISLQRIKMCLIDAAARKTIAPKVLQQRVFLKNPESPSSEVIPLCVLAPLEPYVKRMSAGYGDIVRTLPKYPKWGATFQVEYRPDVDVNALVNLIQEAGFSCGIGELRPSKGGQFGRFSVLAVRAAL